MTVLLFSGEVEWRPLDSQKNFCGCCADFWYPRADVEKTS